MLVLSRRRNESIMVGENIEITISDISRTRVQLGITAPRDVSVHRKEIHKAIQREKAIKNNLHGISSKRRKFSNGSSGHLLRRRAV